MFGLLLFQSTIAEAKSSKVTEEVLDKIAKHYVNELKSNVKFRDKTDAIPFYDLDDNELGYYYQFDNGKDNFFLLLSSNTEYSLLFAAGSGEPSIVNIDNGGKYYYFGNVTLYEAEDGSNVVDFINKKSKRESKITKKELNRLKKKPDAQAKWDSYVSDTADQININATVREHYIDGVKIYNQRGSGVTNNESACGPTTMATIAEYWRSEQGKTRIRGENYYGSAADFINHMYRFHNGTPIGMNRVQLIDGLTDHITEVYDYQVEVDDSVFYIGYKSEIRNDRPVAIKFDDWFVIDGTWGEEYIYDFHWVTGVGYYTDGIDNIIYVHDSVGGTRYIDYELHEDIITMVAFDIQ